MNSETNDILRLPSDLYRRDTLVAAIAAYQRLAVIHLKKEDSYWLLTFTQTQFDPHLTMQEFENYCIGLEARHHERTDH